MKTLKQEFGLTHKAGSTMEICGNGDLGNYILFHTYLHFHPEMNHDDAARESAIFKQRVWDCGTGVYPVTVEEFETYAGTLKDNIVAAFKEAAKKIEGWFNAETASDFEEKIKLRETTLKEIAAAFDDMDHMAYDLPYLYINSDQAALKKIATECIDTAISECVQIVIDVVNTLTGKKQVQDEIAKQKEDAETIQSNFQQTVAEAKEAAKEVAQNSILPQPLVTFDAAPVPVFESPDINKHFVFDKFCKIPADQHTAFEATLHAIIPMVEETKEKYNITGNTVFKLIQYFNPASFIALKVNKKGEYLIGKDALSLMVCPSEQGKLFVGLNSYGGIIKKQPEFFVSLFGEEACKKQTAESSQLMFPIFNPMTPEELMDEATIPVPQA